MGAGARARRQDEYLGTAGGGAIGFRFQSRIARWLWRELADFLRRHRAVLRSGRRLPGNFGVERESSVPAGQPFSAPQQVHGVGDDVPKVPGKTRASDHSLSRWRDDGWSEEQVS